MSKPIEVQKTVTVFKPRKEVFAGLRHRAILLALFDDLSHVDPRRFRFVKSVIGGRVEGEVELDQVVTDAYVSWRASSSSEVPHEGSVRLSDAPEGRGTEVTLRVSYMTPAGRVGQVVLRILGDEPRQVIARHLHRLRQLLEAGEIATTEGQPSGRAEATDEESQPILAAHH